MNDVLPLILAVRGGIRTYWFALIGSGGAFLFPDLVLAHGLFADSFIDRSAVRLIAGPLFLVSAVILTDHYYHWTKGLF